MSNEIQVKTKEYQDLAKIQHKHWTQFEKDLITCIRDAHPILYKKSGDWTVHQRSPWTKKAWKEIEKKFTELPISFIQSTWKKIVDNYIKVKNNPDTETDTKFADGTLHFLDTEIDTIMSHQKKTQPAEDDNNKGESTSSMNSNIKQLIHEEIDISDDDIDIKLELDDDVKDNSKKSIEDNITLPDNKLDAVEAGANEIGENLKPGQKWKEEELLNATRLTQEMIDELIHLKTKHYFTAPVANKTSV